MLGGRVAARQVRKKVAGGEGAQRDGRTVTSPAGVWFPPLPTHTHRGASAHEAVAIWPARRFPPGGGEISPMFVRVGLRPTDFQRPASGICRVLSEMVACRQAAGETAGG